MSPTTIVVVSIVVLVCYGACAYGISQAFRRAKQRRSRDEHAPTTQ
jgi:hypothetical protein